MSKIVLFGLYTLLYFLHCIYADPSPILVGPTRTITTPSAAIGQLTAGGTIILDDGHYLDTFDIPNGLDGYTIKSASGNPYQCYIDGQGGVGAGHRLSYGKGVIHSQSPGTIIGIGFVGGGGADGESDGEAGFYAESFVAPGNMLLINCSFDNNENGIFIPPAPLGSNVSLTVENSVFSRYQPNGVVIDGLCHNVYINANYFKSLNNIHMPSAYGNNLKSRALTTIVQDTYNQHDQGRCLDIPSGGMLTVQGGIYTVKSSSSVSNFMDYAGENTNSGIYTPDISGMTIVGARTGDTIWNNIEHHFELPKYNSTMGQFYCKL